MRVLVFPTSMPAWLETQGRTWIERLSWTGAGALIAIHVALLWRFAVDWPLQDDYTQILAVPGYLAQMNLEGKLGLLFSLTPEHRIVTLRLAGWLGSALPGGLDFRLLIALGNAMGIAAGVCVVLWYPTALRATAALLGALLLTSVTHYGAQYWATGALQHFGVSFYALGTLFALARGQRLLAPVPLAVASAFTSANGLMVFPAAVLLLLMQHRRKEAIAWGLAGGLILAFYFVGYAAPSDRPGLLSLVGEPFLLASLGLVTLGGIGDTFATSLAIGALVVVAWLALFVTGAWRRVPPVVVAGTLFFVLSCTMIAVGRAPLGAEAVALSRYRVYSGFAVLLTFAALAWSVNPRSIRWVLGAAIGGAGILYALAWIAIMPFVVELSMMQAALRDHFAAEGHGYYLGFPREFGDFTLNRARELGFYDGTLDASPPVRAVRANPPVDAASDAWHAEVYPGTQVLSVAGWMGGRHRNVDLWLEDDRQAFRAGLVTVRYRGGPRAGQRTAFHGTVSLAGVPAGSYRIGYAGTAIVWTAKRVEVR
jgi:hypothetical protein